MCPLAGAGGELGALLLALPLQGWQWARGMERKEIYIKYVNMLLVYVCAGILYNFNILKRAGTHRHTE